MVILIVAPITIRSTALQEETVAVEELEEGEEEVGMEFPSPAKATSRGLKI